MSRFVHLWFTPKRRRPVLEGEIAAKVEEFIREAAVGAGIEVVAVSLPVDHVHLLLRLDGGQTIAWAANRLKGASARRLFQFMPELKLDMKGDHLWQRGYGAREVPESQLVTVRDYVETQFERPIGTERRHFRERTHCGLCPVAAAFKPRARGS